MPRCPLRRSFPLWKISRRGYAANGITSRDTSHSSSSLRVKMCIRDRDQLEYILESSAIDGDKYYPLLLTVNGKLGVDDVMRLSLIHIWYRIGAHCPPLWWCCPL